VSRERHRIEVYEERLAIHARDRGICQTCGEPVSVNHFEVAHKIANSVANRKRYGDEVVDSPVNKATTHRGRCNSGQNCGNNPMKCAEIVRAVEAIKHAEEIAVMWRGIDDAYRYWETEAL
jgi:hypothetical protein